MELRIGVLLRPTLGDAGAFLADVAALEAAGVDSLWLQDRAIVPGASDRDPELEPWPLLAGIAAVTHRVRIGTVDSAIAAWPPVRFAAVTATLDRLSRGRLLVGVSSTAGLERFPANTLQDDDRWQRLAEAVEVVRAVWAGLRGPVHRTYYDLPALAVAPPARAGGPPIFIDARGGTSIEMASRLGDGLLLGGGTPHEVRSAAAQVTALHTRTGGRGDLELWTQVPGPGSRAAWSDTLQAYGSTGVTGLIVPEDRRMLDLLRNPDIEDDRSDLALAQG